MGLRSEAQSPHLSSCTPPVSHLPISQDPLHRILSTIENCTPQHMRNLEPSWQATTHSSDRNSRIEAQGRRAGWVLLSYLRQVSCCWSLCRIVSPLLVCICLSDKHALVCFSPMVSFASESLSYHTQCISVSICPGSPCFSLALYFSIAFSSSLLPLLVSVHSFPPSYNSAGPIQASLVRAHAPSASLGISKPS